MDRATGGEVRAEGRTLAGTVMVYGDYSPSHRERFESRSLAPVGDVWLDIDHDRRAVVAWQGAGLALDFGADGVTLRAEVPRTVPGDEALAGVRDGTRKGLSIEFKARRERREAQTGTRVIEAADLRGIGLVPAPSYEGSQVETRQRTGFRLSGRVALGRNL